MLLSEAIIYFYIFYRRLFVKRNFWLIIILIILGIGLYLLSRSDYLLFHLAIETAILVVGILIFTISIISRNFYQSSFVVTLGPGIFVSSLIAFIHMATYKGMNIIEGYDANLPTELWIVLNYILAASILVAILFGNRKVNFNLNLIIFSFIGISGTLLCFMGLFPSCFIEGSGLTLFKKVSEYIFILTYLICLLLIYVKRSKLDIKIYNSMLSFLILLIIGEFMLTLYSDVYGVQNFLGHYFRLVAFLNIYWFVVIESIQKPYNSIFKELTDLTKQFEAILDHIPGLIFYKDKKNNFVTVNKYMADAHQISKIEIEGKNAEEIYPLDDAKKYYEDDLFVIESGEARLNIEEPWETDGENRWVNTSKIPLKDDKDEIIGVLGLSFDITEKHRLELELERLTRVDFLTNINNRRYFVELAENELIRNKRYNNSSALLMIDIDHFKKVNDKYGHAIGDKALKKITEVCIQTIRTTDFMGRLGGEEFGIYLINTDFDEAIEVAERIRENINNIDIEADDSTKLELSVSIGVTKPLSVDEKLNEIMKRADKAMFKAKHLGRNRVAAL
jgi:diguanylate cyclase (GGDEF)-like protein/PAS domain S-box-containing protein